MDKLSITIPPSNIPHYPDATPLYITYIYPHKYITIRCTVYQQISVIN